MEGGLYLKPLQVCSTTSLKTNWWLDDQCSNAYKPDRNTFNFIHIYCEKNWFCAIWLINKFKAFSLTKFSISRLCDKRNNYWNISKYIWLWFLIKIVNQSINLKPFLWKNYNDHILRWKKHFKNCYPMVAQLIDAEWEYMAQGFDPYSAKVGQKAIFFPCCKRKVQ